MVAVVAAIIIAGLIELFYRQTYSVSLKGEIIGYTTDKVALQKRINDYIKTGDHQKIAFVEVDDLPTYASCLLKNDVETNDDEIFEKVIENAKAYSKYYAITDNNEEKVYTTSFSEAEDAVNKLKEKDSANSDSLGIVEKYGVADKNEEDENEIKIMNDDNQVEISSVDTCVDKVYVEKEKPKVVTTTKKSSSSSSGAYKSVEKTVYNESSVSTNLGISLIRPVSGGTISSRFGYRSRDNHKGLDIAAPQGTAIKAAASGTVIFAGSGAPYSGYGNIVVVQSSDSVSIRYAHCVAIYVRTGEYVEQGQVIAGVGSTGISTGNHLHFEIRYNGNAVDPQNYVYN
ncbi:MAG: M23 family metallopeptidase [Clostridia bacterium]|nr:M23 family metallopeptidase [Clostridia bacterium]